VSAAHWPWTVLDIAPTEDRKTIREAYARLLKALDHDAETETYMALRDARDAALSGEFLAPPNLAADEVAPDDMGLGDIGLSDPGVADSESPAAFAAAEASDPDPVIDSGPAVRPKLSVEYSTDDDNRFQRMVDLFLGEGELSPAEIDELNKHLDSLFTDDRMADLGHYARIETWLAQLLADRYPRADTLFPRVAGHFQWHERAHELGIHPAIPWLFGMHEGQALVREISTPGHAYHREWIELTKGKPKGMLWTRGVDRPRMANLIATVRRDYPWLEAQHWQSELVERWEKKVEGGGVKGPGLGTWIVLAIFVLTLLARIVGDAPSGIDHNPAANAALAAANAEKHIAQFISQFPDATADGRSVETLRAKSPRIYSTLLSSANMPESLSEERGRGMMRDVMETYYLIVDKLPYDVQVADARFRAATIKTLKDNPQDCAAFIRYPQIYLRQRANVDALSPDYRYTMFSVVHDYYGDGEWGLIPKTASISGDLIGKLVKRSGVPEARLRATLRSRDGPETDVCRTMGSFFELLTEIPAKQASKILPAVL